MAKPTLRSALILSVLLATCAPAAVTPPAPAVRPAAQPAPPDDPALKEAETRAIDAQYAQWKTTLTPKQLQWEDVLAANLGSFYFPARKKNKAKGMPEAWDYVEDDPKLPRVLLIGDSISRGYTLAVRAALAGKANVHRAPENCGPSSNGLKKLPIYLGDGKWNVIHFNFGIHDRKTDPAVYAANLEQLVTRLEPTGARLIWARTTPVLTSTNAEAYTPEQCARVNQIADGVMQRHHIPENDLCALVEPRLAELQLPDNVHFKEEGYKLLAGQVAAQILARLGGPAPAAAATPLIFWHSQPVSPAATVMLAGANFTAGSVVEACRLPDLDPGAPVAFDPQGPGLQWQPLTTLQLTPQLAQAGMPAGSEGVFACRVRTGTLAGAARRINAPDAWFAQGDLGETASPGGWIGVFGTCLAWQGAPVAAGPHADAKPAAPVVRPATPRPLLALVSNGKVVRTLAARPADGTRYGQFFDLPANLPAGNYDLQVHNGRGGPQGWSPLDSYSNAEHITTIAIAARPAWPQTQVDVRKLPGADDDARFAAAIESTRQGGVIFVPAGTYKLAKPLVLPNQCLLRGAGPGRTKIEWTADPLDSKGKPAPLVSGAELKGSSDPYNRRASFSIEDVSLRASASFTGRVIMREGTREPAHFRRVAVTVPSPRDAMGDNSQVLAIALTHTRNLTISECDLDARNGINLSKEVSHLRCTDNRFRWRNLYFYLMRGPNNIIIAHNRFTMVGTWVGNGFTEAMNANPGFGYAGYDQDNARGLYYAHNLSDRAEKDPPHGSIGITFDQSGPAYFGQLRAVNGTKLTLTGQTIPANIYHKPPCQPGATVRIVAGRGAGQWRVLLTKDTAVVSELEIDRTWDVEPDTESWVAVSYVHGKALFVGNRFGNEALLQTYFSTDDVVFADNILGVPGKQVAMPVWVQGGLNSWHYQVLDNQVTELGARMTTAITHNKQHADYTGPVTGTHIYRNNRAANAGAVFSIQVPDRSLGYLIEGNRGLTEIKPGKIGDGLGLARDNTDRNGEPIPSQPATDANRMNR